MRVQDTLFELRGKLAEHQDDNLTLKVQLAPKEDWETESAKYGVVQTEGGADICPRWLVITICDGKGWQIEAQPRFEFAFIRPLASASC